VTGDVPSHRVLSQDQVTVKQKEILIAEGIIHADEVVEYLHSEGILSIREGGSVLTNQRVIAYERDENDYIDVWFINFDEIDSVELVQQGDALNYSIYRVNERGSNDESWLTLVLPHEPGDDVRFIVAVKAKIRN
jgi:hypothetical protein